MNEEAGFLSAIRREPADETARLVYADWLDEQGDPENAAKAAFIRLELQLAVKSPEQLQAIAHPLPSDWLAVVSRTQVEPCRMRLEIICPGRWSRMEPQESIRTRRCGRCEKPVHFCDTTAEAEQRMRLGDSVAISPAVARKPGDVVGLRPIMPHPFRPIPIRRWPSPRRTAPKVHEPHRIEDKPAEQPRPKEPVHRRQKGRRRHRNIQREQWEE